MTRPKGKAGRCWKCWAGGYVTQTQLDNILGYEEYKVCCYNADCIREIQAPGFRRVDGDCGLILFVEEEEE